MKVPWVALLLGLTATTAPAKDPAQPDVQRLIRRALHLEKVQGEPEQAIPLYRRALKDRSLSAEGQAHVRYRLALCLAQTGEEAGALQKVKEALAAKALPKRLRAPAIALRTSLEAKARTGADSPKNDPTFDAVELSRAQHVRELLENARRALQEENWTDALLSVHLVLYIEPRNAAALAMRDQLQERLQKETEFVRESMQFLKSWTEARTKAVESRARQLLLSAKRERAFNRAEAYLQQAIQLLDESEFGAELDRLVELRQRIVETWRTLRARKLGTGRAEPPVPKARRRSILRSNFVSLLGRMLELVSSRDQEYRLMAIRVQPTKERMRLTTQPTRRHLLQEPPRHFTPALFAQHVLTTRIESESWKRPGHFLEAEGTMLLGRNKPGVLDRVAAALKDIERPSPGPLRLRIVAFSATQKSLLLLRRRHGAFRVSSQGPSPLLLKRMPAGFTAARTAEFFRRSGVFIDAVRDVYTLTLANGRAQAWTLAAHLREAPGYEDGGRGLQDLELDLEARRALFGLGFEAYPLRHAATGRITTALQIRSRAPTQPLAVVRRGTTRLYPRFVEQRCELLEDFQPGTCFVLTGIQDPFSPSRSPADDRPYVILWEFEGGKNKPATDAEPPEAEEGLKLGELLILNRDRPGPRRDPRRGFVPTDPLDALRGRARYLEAFLRRELGMQKIRIEAQSATLHLPRALEPRAKRVVADLRNESAKVYEIAFDVRSVRTVDFERWLRRQDFGRPRSFGAAAWMLTKARSGETLLRDFSRAEGDLFAPGKESPPLRALGLQARHVRFTRTRTRPSSLGDNELRESETATITEGLRITVRPYVWGKPPTLRAHVAIATAAAETGPEAAVGGFAVEGEVDLGAPGEVRTALFARIPHPTRSTPERLTELLVALTIRPAE